MFLIVFFCFQNLKNLMKWNPTTFFIFYFIRILIFYVIILYKKSIENVSKHAR